MDEGEKPKSDAPLITEGLAGRPRPQVTFMGNSYDLVAVVAVVMGGIIFVSCLSCNTAWYCLPPLAVILGVVGLISAEDSIDPARTRLLSWLGIGGGAAVVVLTVLAFVVYFLFVFGMVMLGAAAD